MRYVTIKQDIVGDYIHIDYKTDNDTSIKISANIYLNAYPSIHLSIQKEICTEFEVNYHCIPIPNLFPTLRKAEDMARNYSEEAKEILNDLILPEEEES